MELQFVAVTVFFFNDTATTEIYTLSLHDALPIWYKNSFDFFKEISPYVGALWAFYFIKRFIPSGNK